MKRLREIAEAATPGRWESRRYGINKDSWGVHSERYGAVAATGTDHGETGAKDDAEHIATFDPPTVLALLNVAEAASVAADEPWSGGIDTQDASRLTSAELELREALARLREVAR